MFGPESAAAQIPERVLWLNGCERDGGEFAGVKGVGCLPGSALRDVSG